MRWPQRGEHLEHLEHLQVKYFPIYLILLYIPSETKMLKRKMINMLMVEARKSSSALWKD
jgi:hypothetical protein